ncbi:hypothetical protein BS627_20080 [Agrobacterium salinitolerans]|nr:hypothetical protein BS627_20080 [Agrobacterium salinitolerans]
MSNGRDGAEEHRDFSVFSRWPTKRQPSFLPIRRPSVPAFDAQGAATWKRPKHANLRKNICVSAARVR